MNWQDILKISRLELEIAREYAPEELAKRGGRKVTRPQRKEVNTRMSKPTTMSAKERQGQLKESLISYEVFEKKVKENVKRMLKESEDMVRYFQSALYNSSTMEKFVHGILADISGKRAREILEEAIHMVNQYIGELEAIDIKKEFNAYRSELKNMSVEEARKEILGMHFLGPNFIDRYSKRSGRLPFVELRIIQRLNFMERDSPHYIDRANIIARGAKEYREERDKKEREIKERDSQKMRKYGGVSCRDCGTEYVADENFKGKCDGVSATNHRYNLEGGCGAEGDDMFSVVEEGEMGNTERYRG